MVAMEAKNTEEKSTLIRRGWNMETNGALCMVTGL